MITLAQFIVIIGFALGLTGTYLNIQNPPRVKETWTNFREWSLGLKLMISGIFIWVIGLLIV
jgi:hypothetical protein